MLEQRNRRISLAVVAAGAALVAGCGGGEEDGAEDAALRGEAQQAALGRAGGAVRFVANQAIVAFREPPRWSEIRTLGGRRVSPVRALGERTYLVQLDDLPAVATAGAGGAAVSASSGAGAATFAAVSALASARDLVESATPNELLELSLTPSDPLWVVQQWNYGALQLPAAWDITTGGSGARIAILDTGKTTHPDFIWGSGRDFIDGDTDPTDLGIYHHGIHVAGIAGARANNGLGGLGVCWNCTLVPVRVGDLYGIPIANIAAGIRWVAGYSDDPWLPPAPPRADVINMSFNTGSAACGTSTYDAVRTAISDAISRGVAVVASAGNQSALTVTTPADCPGVIAVAASQPGGSLPAYTNRGAGVDLVAPGGGPSNSDPGWGLFGASVGAPTCLMTGASNPGIPGAGVDPYNGTQGVVSSWSTWRPTPQLTYWDNCYRYLSGTSMAAPHVAGVVGLMRSVNPSLSPDRIQQYMTETANLSAVTCPAPGQCGAGMLDAQRAVLAARDGLPDIDVSPGALAFPITPIFTESTLPLTVRNVLTGPLSATLTLGSPKLTLSCASGTCACTPTTCSLYVPPGQQAVVNVHYAPTDTVALSSYVRIASNDPNEGVVQVPATAAIFGHARTSPDIIHFGYQEVGATSSAQEASLFNIGTGPLTISSLSITGDTAHYIVSPQFGLPAVVAPGGSVRVQIRCAPASAGRKNLWLGFNTNAAFQGAVVNARCEATAPDGRLLIQAPGPEFGEQPIDVLTTSTVSVLNISTGSNTLSFSLTRPAAPFSLSCVSGCTCTTSACTGSVSAGHSGAVLSLGFEPVDLLKYSASMTFTSNTPGSAPQVVTVKGRGVLGPTTDPVPGPTPEEPLPD